MICAVLANLHTRKGKRFKPDDFMPKERRRQTVAEQIDILQFAGQLVGKRSND